MDLLIIEIEKFLKISTYAQSSKKIFRYFLPIFAQDLSEITDTPISDLHLERIIEQYDNEGNFVTYLQITTDILDQYLYDRIYKGYYWLRDMRNTLSAFFRHLYRNYDFKNVIDDLEFNLNKYKPKNKAIKTLSKHDVLKFFHYLVSYSENLDRDILLFTLIITTGCRKSEIMNLRVQDVYWEDNTILLPKTKHYQSRTIPLRQGIATYIRIYCDNYGIHSEDRLFNLSSKQLSDLFHYYLNIAKLPKVGLHSLRHTFATFMTESGTDITVVQQLLGHSDLFTTKGYVHSNTIFNKNITIKENQEVYSALSKFIKG
jgi:integrase